MEPYSLEAIPYKELAKAAIVPEEERRKLEEVAFHSNLLRAGHFIYGRHHFLVTVCLQKFLAESSLGAEICSDLRKKWQRCRFDLVLTPLNSHIGYLLPRLQEAFLLFHGLALNVATCIPLLELADRPYYSLPGPAAKMMAERASLMAGPQGERVSGLNILILDDAVASGRTLDTIIRALLRKARRLMDEEGLSRSLVSQIVAYAVIDRRSLARQTFLNSISQLRMINEPFSEFSLHTWLHMDMPVEETGSCYLCDEREAISAMSEACRLPREHPIRRELQRRQDALEPVSTETPGFVEGKGSGRRISIQWAGGLQSTTYELAMLDFHNLLSRGYPIGSLVEKYRELTHRRAEAENETGALMDLQRQMGREFFRRWKQACSQHSQAAWRKAMEAEIRQGSTLVRDLLPLAGMAMARWVERDEDELVSLCEEAVKELGTQSDTTSMWNLAVGASLWLLYHSHYLPPDKEGGTAVSRIEEALQTVVEDPETGERGRLFLEVVRGTLACPAGERRFLPALGTVLNHTLRPARNPMHRHLVPFSLQRIAQGETLDQWERRAVAASLSDFWEALEHCHTVIPTWRESDRLRHYIEGYREMVTHLVHLLSTEDEDNKETAISLALEIGGGWLRDPGDEPFKVIARVNVALSDVLAELASACKAKGIDFVLPELMDVSVLVPSNDATTEVLANWTHYNVEKQGEPGDKVAVSVKEVHGLVEVILYTRFAGRDVNVERIKSGRNASELLNYTWTLFDAKLDRVLESPTFREERFDVGIVATFALGLSPGNSGGGLP